MPGPVDDLDHGSYDVAYGIEDRHRRHPQERCRGLPARVAAGHGDGFAGSRARWQNAGTSTASKRSPVRCKRPTSGRGKDRRRTPGFLPARRPDEEIRREGRAVPQRNSDRAHALCSAVCVRRRAARRARFSVVVRACLDHAGSAGSTDGRDGGQPLSRSRHRRAQPAHGAARGRQRRALAGHDGVGDRRRAGRPAGGGLDAQSAVRRVDAGRRAAPVALPALQTLYVARALRARRRRRARTARAPTSGLRARSRGRRCCYFWRLPSGWPDSTSFTP